MLKCNILWLATEQLYHVALLISTDQVSQRFYLSYFLWHDDKVHLNCSNLTDYLLEILSCGPVIAVCMKNAVTSSNCNLPQDDYSGTDISDRWLSACLSCRHMPSPLDQHIDVHRQMFGVWDCSTLWRFLLRVPSRNHFTYLQVLQQWCTDVVYMWCLWSCSNIPVHDRIAAVHGSVIDYKYGMKTHRRFPAVLLVMDRFKCDLHTAIQNHMKWLDRSTLSIVTLHVDRFACETNYRKNLNTIRMILTKIRGPVEGLHIIQVNKKTHKFPVFKISVSSGS